MPAEYKPDTLKNYEAGIKSRWLDQSLQLNLTAFFMEWEDIQLNRSGSTAGNPWWMRGTFNGGKAEQKGVETQHRLVPDREFQHRCQRVHRRSRIFRRHILLRTATNLYEAGDRGRDDDADFA